MTDAAISTTTDLDARPHGRVHPRHLTIGALVLLAVAALLSLSIGATGIGLAALPRAMSAAWAGTQNTDSLVLLNLRLPRLLLGMFVGAALATAGAMMQGLFRNPLADPGVIGVSSGAALAAITTIALGNVWAAPLMKLFGVYALPISAFLGGLCTTTLLLAMTRRGSDVVVATLLLAGIAVAAFAGSLIGLIAYASDDRELRDLTLWQLGSLSGASWPKVLAIMPFALGLGVLLPRMVRSLNGLLLGEAEAYHLGIDVARAKKLIVLTTAAAVGAAVAVAGIIGFVGIVVPHLVRLLGGPDNRVVLPISALLGGSAVLIADIVARMAVRPAELPLGIVLAAVGAPVFLHLVLRRGFGRAE